MKNYDKYIEFIQSSRLMQIRLVSLLTGVLYIIYSQVDKEILTSDALSTAVLLHLYIMPPLLFLISILTLWKHLHKYIIYLLMFTILSATIGNLYLIMNIDEYTIYLTELYLIVFWVFTVSGLRLIHATVTVVCILTIGFIWKNFFFKLDDSISAMHTFWLLSTCSFGFLIAFLFERFSKTIFLKNQKLRELTFIDNLTGLYNRKKLNEILYDEVLRCKRYEHSLGLIILDIDSFKIVNDTYGHQIGDEVLKELANILKQNIRSTDLSIRWGGEEFVIVCLETSFEGTLKVAENLRKSVENNEFSTIGKKTISLGITEYKKDDTVDSLIKRADDALYLAKKNGKNRIELIV